MTAPSSEEAITAPARTSSSLAALAVAVDLGARRSPGITRKPMSARATGARPPRSEPRRWSRVRDEPVKMHQRFSVTVLLACEVAALGARRGEGGLDGDLDLLGALDEASRPAGVSCTAKDELAVDDGGLRSAADDPVLRDELAGPRDPPRGTRTAARTLLRASHLASRTGAQARARGPTARP